MNSLIKLYNYWLKIDDKIRFILIGGVNAAVSYIIFVLLILILSDKHHQICIAGQWLLSTVPSYLNQKFFVFNTRGNYFKEYLKCCSTWTVSYILNAIIFEISIRYILKNVFWTQFFSLIIVSVVTYILFKYFAFKSKNNKLN